MTNLQNGGDNHSQTGIIAWFATNHVAANLLMILIIAMGIMALTDTRRELQPDLTIDVIQVMIAYPGASPTEVEQGLTVKIEEAIQDIEGIEEFRSYSRENTVSMYIDVLNGFTVSRVMDDIKTRIDGISNLPEQAEEPLISQVTARYPAIMVQLSGDIDEKTLQRVMRQARREMLQIPAISSVEIYGLRDYEISVEVSETELKKFQLSLRDIANAINASSLDLAGGSIRTRGGDILLRTSGQAYDQKAFEGSV